MEEHAEHAGEAEAARVEEKRTATYGDFLIVDYTLLAEDTNELYKTTMEEDAKKYRVFSESSRYGPTLLILGAGWLHRNIEKLFLGMAPGEEKQGVLQPKDAFGERDPRNIKTIRVKKLEREGITIRVGERVIVNGREGRIDSVSGGRVRIDFNHPLASKRVRYKLILHKILESMEEKIKAIVNHVFPSSVRVSLKDRIVTIDIPQEVVEGEENIVGLKQSVLSLISRYVKEIEEVRFVEHYKIS